MTQPGRWFGQLPSYSYGNDCLNYASGRQDSDEQRALINGTQGGSVDLAWQLGDYRLRSITAFRNLYFDARNDEGTVFDISTQGGGGIRYAQWSQELRLDSPVGGALDYQVGLYAIRSRGLGILIGNAGHDTTVGGRECLRQDMTRSARRHPHSGTRRAGLCG